MFLSCLLKDGKELDAVMLVGRLWRECVNHSVNQSELLKLFLALQLRAPKTAGLRAAVPLAPAPPSVALHIARQLLLECVHASVTDE